MVDSIVSKSPPSSVHAKDLQDIPENVKNKLEIIPVKWIDRVLEIALESVPQPLPDDDPVKPAEPKADPGVAGTASEVLTH